MNRTQYPRIQSYIYNLVGSMCYMPQVYLVTAD